MTSEKLRNALKGVAVTTATPFTEDLSNVDLEALEENLRFLSKHGISLFVPCGNTGEYYSLSDEEWTSVVETTIESSSNDACILVGAGGSIKTALNQAKIAGELGADGIMIMYPRHVFASAEGLLNYCQRIIDAAKDIGVVLYKKGGLMTDAVLASLFENENLVGVKYAHGRIVDFAKTVQDLGADLVWSCGTAERFAPFFWLAGAEGFTSGLGNFAPEISLQMFDSLKKSDFSAAMEIQRMITPLEYLREGRDKANNVPVVKTALDYVGLNGGRCRPPIHPLRVNERREILEVIESWNLPEAR
jgi:4-hydroxy-tetrahydrodipicolinate synthase